MNSKLKINLKYMVLDIDCRMGSSFSVKKFRWKVGEDKPPRGFTKKFMP